MTAREALLRGILRDIRKGHTYNVAPEHIEAFLQQLEADSPELLAEESEASQA